MQERLFTECVDIVGTACKPFEGKKTYISTGAVDCDHISLLDTETINYEGRPSRANLVVEVGDVIFAKMQATQKTLLIDEELAQNVYSTGFCAVRAKRNILTNRCLYHLLTSDMFLSQKDKNCSGATQKSITNAGLSKIRIQTPDIGEQDRISVILDGLSDVIVKRKQELSILDDLIKARFVEVLKGEKTIPVKLKDIVEQDRIITYGMVKPGKDVPGGVIIIKVKDFPSGVVETDDFLHADPLLEAKYVRSRVKEGDLLYSIRGTVGRTAFVTKNLVGANITQDTARLSISRDRYNANYVRYALGYDDVVRQIESQIKGVAMKGISLSELREIEIPCVNYDSQQEFGIFVEQVDKSKAAVQKALDETHTLFNSLMQQYFG